MEPYTFKAIFIITKYHYGSRLFSPANTIRIIGVLNITCIHPRNCPYQNSVWLKYYQTNHFAFLVRFIRVLMRYVPYYVVFYIFKEGNVCAQYPFNNECHLRKSTSSISQINSLCSGKLSISSGDGLSSLKWSEFILSRAAKACTILNIMFFLSLVWYRNVVFWLTLSKQIEKLALPTNEKTENAIIIWLKNGCIT